MSTANESVQVRIMQHTFSVVCSKEERRGVLAAAAYLDQQMRTVATGAEVLGIDRCAIMAGLNISHELLAVRDAARDQAQIHARLKTLHQQVDEAVTNAQ